MAALVTIPMEMARRVHTDVVRPGRHCRRSCQQHEIKQRFCHNLHGHQVPHLVKHMSCHLCMRAALLHVSASPD